VKHPRRWILILFLLAVAIRVGAGLEWDRWPATTEEAEWETAALVYQTSGFAYPDNVAARPPLYSMWMAGIYSAFGGRSIAVRVGQAILGGLTCLVALWIGCRVVDDRVGRWAAVLCALHPLLVGSGCMLTADVLFVFLFAAAFALSLLFAEHPTDLRGFALGACLGLVALCSQVVFAWVPLMLGGFAIRGGRSTIGPVSRVVCAMLLVILPWTIRNHLVTDRFVPVAPRLGFEMLIGHEPRATGGFDVTRDYLGMFGKLSIDEENVVDRDRVVAARVTEWIVEDPLRSMELFVQKLGHLWNPFVPGGRPLQHLGSLVLIAPLLGLGLWSAVDRRREPLGWLALTAAVAFSLVHGLLYSEGRFRLPVDFALLVPAADRGLYCAARIGEAVRTRWLELADGGTGS